jgi:hypothetical protein
VLPVKFDGGLSILVLRNEQLFTKNWKFNPDQFSKSSKFEIFQIPPFGKRYTPTSRVNICSKPFIFTVCFIDTRGLKIYATGYV